MTKNTYVKIIASPELSRMKLGGLAGRRGLVVEDLSGEDRKTRAGWFCWKRPTWMSLSGSFPKNP